MSFASKGENEFRGAESRAFRPPYFCRFFHLFKKLQIGCNFYLYLCAGN